MLRQALKLLRGKPPEAEAVVDDFVERRIEPRLVVFREAALQLEDYYKIRAVITELSRSGARVQFDTRVDLPFRVVLIEPTFKLKLWARVVWQRDGAAGLAFLGDA